MEDISSPYLSAVHKNLPRVLSLFDTNPISKTYGLGDRLFWAWKLKDFTNATFQGVINGLSRLITHNLLPPYLDEKATLSLIDTIILSIKPLIRRDGSLEEAFPYESSFCVTALVAYDLLTCIKLLTNKLPTNKLSLYKEICHPLIQFLIKHDETHGIISNHLATAAVACFLWHDTTKDKHAEKKGEMLISRILSHQSANHGWFKEYEGADPGYQTLCTYYLSELHSLRPDLNLDKPLKKSLQFLWHFAHPDGSFGGIYGSRNTRVYYPGGIRKLSNTISEAKILDTFMASSIHTHKTVTLDAIDSENLIPLFNSYCLAASIENPAHTTHANEIPALKGDSQRFNFDDTGIFIHRSKGHYTIINYFKGGVCYHFNKLNSQSSLNCGVLLRDKKHYLSSQKWNINNSVTINRDSIEIESSISIFNQPLPSPSKFLLLRILNLTIMRLKFASEIIKKMLVKYLITQKNKKHHGKITRVIQLAPAFSIKDKVDSTNHNIQRINNIPIFSTMHMASQGYWQRSDTERKS